MLPIFALINNVGMSKWLAGPSQDSYGSKIFALQSEIMCFFYGFWLKISSVFYPFQHLSKT